MHCVCAALCAHDMQVPCCGFGTERGEEVWAQLADGSCRWRQTGSSITVLCLRVPCGIQAKQLRITIEPYFIRGTLQDVLHHQST